MSWICEEDTRTWVQRLATNTLKQGPIPYHVAFILDGNRRYAKERNMPTIYGHKIGLDTKLNEVLRWCVDLGIREVTMYMFSKDNFKRSSEEVAYLFQIFSDKLQRFLDAGQSFLIWSKARHLIHDGVKRVAEGLSRKEIKQSDVDEYLVENAMQLYPHHNVDVLVRTSETRLSDFVLWECNEGQLCFNETLWPQYSYWNLLEAVMLYQKRDFSSSWQVCQNSMIGEKRKRENVNTSIQEEKRKEKFLQGLRKQVWDVLYKTEQMTVIQ
ncbi:unnamed protein product [Orchesella dallaii]|uniref:ditrans,polycis-polyprenyl diphosphate synthase [(2E,6E)-farnesyldiphosphate specific] n=1 Tax=Orchesella dallaii TaxID=48710 RepID=A0ABP1S8E6_9HEXA